MKNVCFLYLATSKIKIPFVIKHLFVCWVVRELLCAFAKKGQRYPSSYMMYALDGLSFKMVDEMPIRLFSVHQTSR